MGLLNSLDPLLVGLGPVKIMPVQLIVRIEMDQPDKGRDGLLIHLNRHPVSTLRVLANCFGRVLTCIFLKFSGCDYTQSDFTPDFVSLTLPSAISLSIECSTSSEAIPRDADAADTSTAPLLETA